MDVTHGAPIEVEYHSSLYWPWSVARTTAVGIPLA